MSDFIPRADGDLIVWLTGIKTKHSKYPSELGLTPEKSTEVIALCEAVMAALTDKDDRSSAYDQAVLFARQIKAAKLGRLREIIGRWKTEDGYTDPVGADLGLLGGPDAVNPDDLKPEVVAVVLSDHVQLRFRKFGADAVNIYKRKRGEAAWKFLARDTNSPYDDFSPLAAPGVPETWVGTARCAVPRRRAQRQATARTPTVSARLCRPFRAGTAQRAVPTRRPAHLVLMASITGTLPCDARHCVPMHLVLSYRLPTDSIRARNGA